MSTQLARHDGAADAEMQSSWGSGAENSDLRSEAIAWLTDKSLLGIAEVHSKSGFQRTTVESMSAEIATATTGRFKVGAQRVERKGSTGFELLEWIKSTDAA